MYIERKAIEALTTYITGTGSVSGIAAGSLLSGGEGILASGSYTPQFTGKVVVNIAATAIMNSGMNVQFALVSGTGALASGIGTPALLVSQTPQSGDHFTAAQNILLSGLPVGTAINFAVLMSTVAASGLASGAASIIIQEQQN